MSLILNSYILTVLAHRSQNMSLYVLIRKFLRVDRCIKWDFSGAWLQSNFYSHIFFKYFGWRKETTYSIFRWKRHGKMHKDVWETWFEFYEYKNIWVVLFLKHYGENKISITGLLCRKDRFKLLYLDRNN